MKQKLPIGIQTFGEIRRDGYLYIGKTPIISDLIANGKYYFLARPCRFGKSLTLSTIKDLFLGNKELFEGLWIENHWNWEATHPVIHIGFSSLGYKESLLYIIRGIISSACLGYSFSAKPQIYTDFSLFYLRESVVTC